MNMVPSIALILVLGLPSMAAAQQIVAPLPGGSGGTIVITPQEVPIYKGIQQRETFQREQQIILEADRDNGVKPDLKLDIAPLKKNCPLPLAASGRTANC